MSIQAYHDAGYRVFTLYPMTKDGQCACDNPDCDNAGKHPTAAKWQLTPHWSDEQFDNLVEHTAAKDGFGVLVKGFLVVDVDPRNGGNESLEKLDPMLGTLSTLVVNTGSGGLHIYFDLPADKAAYVQHVKDYPGIDFKTSGYVVGVGSLHKSGKRYTTVCDIAEPLNPAPDWLLAMLAKPDRQRVEYKGKTWDVSDKELAGILQHVDPDCDHETWIQCGMALHHATGGNGLYLWDDWSSKGKTYPGTETLDKRWHSFGKCDNPVRVGTLVHYAEQNGYQRPIMLDDEDIAPSDHANVDLMNPPGLTGKIKSWIHDQCRYPRERLATAGALYVMGNIAGLRYTDDMTGVNLNLLMLCTAHSSTGKEAVLQAVNELMKSVGLHHATYGAVKSEQEIVRNLITHQAAYYQLDEMGYLLQKLEGARNGGGASYLQNVISTFMSVYTKADGSYLVSGDIKKDVRNELVREYKDCETRIKNNEDPRGFFRRRAQQIKETALPQIEEGLQRPFLSIFGMTTPVSFDDFVTAEQATNGFVGRSIIVREHESNPRRKQRNKHPVPTEIRHTLEMIYTGGEYEVKDIPRIEYYGDKTVIHTDAEAQSYMDRVYDDLHELAEVHKSRTGLESIVRRGYEQVSRISTILAVPERIRTIEHCQWAYQYVMADIETKINLAQANINPDTDDALLSRLLDIIGDGEKESVIMQRVTRAKHYKRQDAENMLKWLADNGHIKRTTRKHKGNGTEYYFYEKKG